MSIMTAPDTPTARRSRIEQIISRSTITSQEQLRTALAQEGLEVTQATLSRDLADLGAVKRADAHGVMAYTVPDSARGTNGERPDHRLGRMLADVLVSADHSGNIVVLRTPPGAAQYLASAVDAGGWDSIIGTVAGDDTVLLVTKDPRGGADVAHWFLQWAEKG